MTKNLYHYKQAVGTKDKILKNGHKPCVVWFTGLSGSGKSTIANELEKRLFALGAQTHLLDGDNIRMGLNKDLGFLPHERKENIRRIGEVANLFAQSGTIVITAFISPYDEDRKNAKEKSTETFLQVFVDTPIDICEQRDPKGLYKKARLGIIAEFTGVSSPYEKPSPDMALYVNTTHMTAKECADRIIEELYELNIFGENI